MLLRLNPGDFGRLFSEGIEPEPAAPLAARRLRRQAALRENLAVRAQRLLRVVARFVRPKRVADLPATFDLLLRERLLRPGRLPDPRFALSSADGLAGLASDLAPGAMIEAYGKGLSPSACLGPIAWHSRPRRFVAAPGDVAREFDRPNAGGDPDWAVTFDRDIDFVLAQSGRPPDHSAIMPARLLGGFAELFDAGFAHSFEVRDAAGQTIGGGFGVAVGGVFVLEGAFELAPGAAKRGLSQLARRLGEWNFAAVECAPGAAWLGAEVFRAMPREDYLSLVARRMGDEKSGRWRNDAAVTSPPLTEGRRLAA
jgi:leucyl/phenylalanyl-tRNA---protein transferase